MLLAGHQFHHTELIGTSRITRNVFKTNTRTLHHSDVKRTFRTRETEHHVKNAEDFVQKIKRSQTTS